MPIFKLLSLSHHHWDVSLILHELEIYSIIEDFKQHFYQHGMHVKGTQIYDQYQQLKDFQNNHANKHYNPHVGL